MLYLRDRVGSSVRLLPWKLMSSVSSAALGSIPQTFDRCTASISFDLPLCAALTMILYRSILPLFSIVKSLSRICSSSYSTVSTVNAVNLLSPWTRNSYFDAFVDPIDTWNFPRLDRALIR